MTPLESQWVAVGLQLGFHHHHGQLVLVSFRFLAMESGFFLVLSMKSMEDIGWSGVGRGKFVFALLDWRNNERQ